jgi:Fe-S-cluster containining protein
MPAQPIQAHVQLTIAGRPLSLNLVMPAQAVPPEAMLPLFRQVAEAFLDQSVENEAHAGRAVSCKKGCGACCRQMVPISPTEARLLARLVAQMPRPRKQALLDRFAQALRRLEAAGLIPMLADRQNWPQGHSKQVGLEYFALGIPCPFLEEESCSIYPDRPITCREYLVTSPAENCANPTAGTIRMVPLPAGPTWPAAARFDGAPNGKTPWVPLVLALDYAAEHPEESPSKPGPRFAREFIAAITNSVPPEAP